MVDITIDDQKISVSEGTTILNAARSAGIFIPVVCSHPDLKPFRSVKISDYVYQGENKVNNDPGATIESIKGCGVCIVEIDGEELPQPSCKTEVKPGMVIQTNTDKIKKLRQKNLMRSLQDHPHSCLTCSQRQGCAIIGADCSNNVPAEERCCELSGNCEYQRIVDYVGVAPETPKYKFKDLPRIFDDPLINRDYNLCIGCGRCVRACQQIRGVDALGAVIKDGKLVIGTAKAPYLTEADCRFCGACVEVCPTGALMDKKVPRLKEYYDFIPCQGSCPAELEAPVYVRLVAQGRYEEAGDVISSKLSFPSVLGKVCFHPCEENCRRNEIKTGENGGDNSVSVRMIKDFAMSRYDLPEPVVSVKKTGKNVSIVGAGPAGLTTGYYLALKGHYVTIYEKEKDIGGMLRYGIPRYRLPVDILEKDIERIMQSGVKIRTNISIGKDMPFNSLMDNGADAVYISTGLPKSKRLPINIDDSENIYYGVEFLRKFEYNKIPLNHFKSKNVVIIGGGNVATDAARTAVRLNAESTKLVCLESRDEMPAYPQEIKESLEEGIEIMNSWGIGSIGKKNDKIEIELNSCTSVFDENGKFNPKYDESLKDKISCDAVIICIGQESDIEEMQDNGSFPALKKGLIKVNTNNFETNIKGVFAGGDIVSGPASVVDAVGTGRKAARAIDKYLGGDGIIQSDEPKEFNFDQFIGRVEGFAKLNRKPAEMLAPFDRRNTFQAVEKTYEERQAAAEAGRCLQCDLRLNISHNPLPPEKFLAFSAENFEQVESKEGVIQLLNSDKEVKLIRGAADIRSVLQELSDEGNEAAYFCYEYDPMYTKRESELIQQHLQKHGALPDSGGDLDDLF